MNVILYSTHCPRCDVLEKKLNMKSIEFETIDDETQILQKGFTDVPILEVNSVFMNFKDAVDWVNKQGETK